MAEGKGVHWFWKFLVIYLIIGLMIATFIYLRGVSHWVDTFALFFGLCILIWPYILYGFFDVVGNRASLVERASIDGLPDKLFGIDVTLGDIFGQG